MTRRAGYLVQLRVLQGKLGSVVFILLFRCYGDWTVVVLVQDLPAERRRRKKERRERERERKKEGGEE